MFEHFWSQMKEKFTEFQRKRFIDSFFPILKQMSYENELEIYSLSTEYYLEYRALTFNVEYCLLTIEYGIGISIDENIQNNEFLKNLRKKFLEHLSIVNDSYSFNKEYLADGAKANYASIISRINNCTFQESADIINKQLYKIEDEIFCCIEEIIDREIPVPHIYLSTIENYICEHLLFHQNSVRYEK